MVRQHLSFNFSELKLTHLASVPFAHKAHEQVGESGNISVTVHRRQVTNKV
jgi:hypothetical protein